MAVMYPFTFERVRRKKFEAFWYTHHLAFIFYAACLIHGTGKLFFIPYFWAYFCFPGLVYIIERITRIARAKYGTALILGKQKADGVISLRLKKPSLFKYKAGQYAFINCPQIATFEYHPFTLTSAPFEDFLEVHIKSVGAWTKSLYAAFGKDSQKALTQFNVDGPFGAPAQHVKDFKVVALFGAGIGVTPFASLLKEMKHEMEEKEWVWRKVYLFWSVRNHSAFEWITGTLKEIEEYNKSNETFEIHNYFTGALQEEDIRSFLLHSALNYNYNKKHKCLITGLGSRLHFCRPPIRDIFKMLNERHSMERIGMFYCGPHPLGAMLEKEAKKYEDKIQLHVENF